MMIIATRVNLTLQTDGKEYHKNLLKSMSGYVTQDDLVHAMLTVKETLLYAGE
jgi:ABC-type multidrug transport system ATPase subunit